MQKLGKRPNFEVISEIQRAKFGVFVTYIFGGKIWGSNKNFRGKFWGQAPRPPGMEVPPWVWNLGQSCHGLRALELQCLQSGGEICASQSSLIREEEDDLTLDHLVLPGPQKIENQGVDSMEACLGYWTDRPKVYQA